MFRLGEEIIYFAFRFTFITPFFAETKRLGAYREPTTDAQERIAPRTQRRTQPGAVPTIHPGGGPQCLSDGRLGGSRLVRKLESGRGTGLENAMSSAGDCQGTGDKLEEKESGVIVSRMAHVLGPA